MLHVPNMIYWLLRQPLRFHSPWPKLLNVLASWYRRIRARIWNCPAAAAHHTYKSEEEEQRYWDAARRSHAYLFTSDARYNSFCGVTVPPPVLSSYTPAPPTARSEDTTEYEYNLPSKAFCKWHRMVFPNAKTHPTIRDANILKMRYSVRDRREMHRISRMQTDETVFLGTKKTSSRYRKMWETWLDSKGCDIAIVFEEHS